MTIRWPCLAVLARERRGWRQLAHWKSVRSGIMSASSSLCASTTDYGGTPRPQGTQGVHVVEGVQGRVHSQVMAWAGTDRMVSYTCIERDRFAAVLRAARRRMLRCILRP
jgi:hypothetical protein